MKEIANARSILWTGSIVPYIGCIFLVEISYALLCCLALNITTKRQAQSSEKSWLHLNSSSNFNICCYAINLWPWGRSDQRLMQCVVILQIAVKLLELYIDHQHHNWPNWPNLPSCCTSLWNSLKYTSTTNFRIDRIDLIYQVARRHLKLLQLYIDHQHENWPNWPNLPSCEERPTWRK